MSVSTVTAFTQKQREIALERLAHILESEYFRGSQRCCIFGLFRPLLSGREAN
jgi:hypothetical protein